MWLAHTISDLRRRRRELAGRVAFVPTMGALHAGHVALMEAGRGLADHVLVSIFVNPTQFGPGEDFDRYPRPLEADLEACRAAGVTGVFAPAPTEMYPVDEPPAAVDVPALTTLLEGAHRPGHFQGVCVVVAKLFGIVEPTVAIFGQKDYQQLRVIDAMVRALAMPVEIVAHRTVREPDGLAMSSRNAYIPEEQRHHALGLYKALLAAKELIETQGETDPSVVESAMTQIMITHQLRVDYAAVRHPHTLAALDCIEPKLTQGIVALAAGRLGNVRLIDNMLIGVPNV